MVDFLIIGNGISASCANSIFELFMLKKIKYGYSISSGYRYFEVPDDYEFYGTVYKEEEGKRYIAVSGVRWFTNMRYDCPPPLVLSRKYVEGEYKKFDNFDAINIDKTKDIPDDYMGWMQGSVGILTDLNFNEFEWYITNAKKYYNTDNPTFSPFAHKVTDYMLNFHGIVFRRRKK